MENRPLKIVYLTPALYMAGGVERVLTLKANYFAEHFGYDITIILTEGKDKPLFYPLSPKVKIINLDINFEELWQCSFIKKVFVYLTKQRQHKRMLTKKLMQIRPDLTISLLRREINFLNEIKDGSKKIGELHINRANYRNFDDRESNLIKRSFSKLWSSDLLNHLKKLDRFVVLTEKDRDTWYELNNVSVIPDPLSFVPDSVSTLKEKRVVSVARYSYEKGIDLLLKAWSIFEKENKEWRLDVYGDGDRDEYEQIINDLFIDRKRCCLHGRTDHVEDVYCKSSIFILSSRFEGFGMVIIEAMACGLPVIAFDCPWGPQSIIDNKVDGLLVPNGNVEKLAETMKNLILDEDTLRQISKKAKKNSERFRIQGIAEEWKQLFENVM